MVDQDRIRITAMPMTFRNRSCVFIISRILVEIIVGRGTCKRRGVQTSASLLLVHGFPTFYSSSHRIRSIVSSATLRASIRWIVIAVVAGAVRPSGVWEVVVADISVPGSAIPDRPTTRVVPGHS